MELTGQRKRGEELEVEREQCYCYPLEGAEQWSPTTRRSGAVEVPATASGVTMPRGLERWEIDPRRAAGDRLVVARVRARR